MRSKYSAIFLVLVNLYPIYGVVFLGWNAKFILYTYWCENLIIGLFTVLKMLKTKIYLDNTQLDNPNLNTNNVGESNSSKILSFIWVYCGASFLYYIVIAILTTETSGTVLFNLPRQIIVPVGFIFLSHTFSYVVNFIIGAEYKKLSLDEEIKMPVRRLVIVHLTVTLGSLVIKGVGVVLMIIMALFFGLTIPQSVTGVVLLIIMVLAKIFLDIIAHLQEHNGIKKVGEEIKFSQ